MLLEGALVEQLEAEGAVEVLWVPLLSHGSDAFAYYHHVVELIKKSKNALTYNVYVFHEL